MLNFKQPFAQQTGAVLITSLMMLVVMTILAISSINSSTVNLHIVNNMQSMREVEDAAQDGINQILSSSSYFLTNTAATTLTAANGKTVDIETRTCLQANVSAGNTLQGVNRITQNTPPPDMTVWDVKATVDDNTTNAKVTVHQGVKIQLPAGNC